MTDFPCSLCVADPDVATWCDTCRALAAKLARWYAECRKIARGGGHSYARTLALQVVKRAKLEEAPMPGRKDPTRRETEAEWLERLHDLLSEHPGGLKQVCRERVAKATTQAIEAALASPYHR